MQEELSSSTHTGPPDSEETEGVLVDAHESSDDEIIIEDNDDGDDKEQLDFGSDDECWEHNFEDDEDDEDEMNMVRVGLHDLNTLTHLYRFGLLNTANISRTKYAPSDDLNKKISIWRGDITKLQVDAMVNAANKSLLGGGGVDGAIHTAAGPDLLKECRRLNGCKVGNAKMSGAYRLPAQKIIHTVGPIYFTDESSAPGLLVSCYQKSLDLAKKSELKSIAFPSLSTGIYGYPIRDATMVAAETVRQWLESPVEPEKSSSPPNSTIMDRVIFCVFSANDEEVYNEIVPTFFPPSEEDLAAEKEQEDASDSVLSDDTDRKSG